MRHAVINLRDLKRNKDIAYDTLMEAFLFEYLITFMLKRWKRRLPQPQFSPTFIYFFS